MKPSAWLGSLCMLALSAATANAAPNPFYEAYNGDIAVTDISVTYADGILETHSDRAARNFVENAFPAELRGEFETAAAQTLDDDAYAERVSEFLLARSLRTHTSALNGAHGVRLEVDVTEARINGMLTGALFGGAAFPRLDGAVRIVDAQTGALLATARIRNSQSWDAHNQAAARTQGFGYNFSGTDTNFRLLSRIN